MAEHPGKAPEGTPGSRARIAAKLTPAMQQYVEFKSAHADALLFFRMGDFYELFFEDAEDAAALLDLIDGRAPPAFDPPKVGTMFIRYAQEVIVPISSFEKVVTGGARTTQEEPVT